MKMKRTILAILSLILSVALTVSAQTEVKPAAAATTETAPTLNPRVKMVTSMGDMIIQLNGEKAPITVQNFVRYAEENFFNGTIFHRVMSTFMIQGGGFTQEMDQKMAGTHPPIKNEWKNGLKNDKYSIAMARLGGQPDSATSQFFINVADNASLDVARDGAAYAVFGKVVKGMEVVDEIKMTPVGPHPKYAGGSQPTVPQTPVVIKSVTLIDKLDKEALNKRIQEIKLAAEKELRAFIAKFEKENNKKILTTQSGLMYCHLVEGTGVSPKPTNTVKVHYQGTLLNGEEFDSSYKRGTPATFGLSQVIKGWTEGVGMMKPGGKALLICPPDLAYGDRGELGGKTLVFTVELLAVQ